MTLNGATNYSFESGNTLPSVLQTATNSGMVTNGMQSRSVGGRRRRMRRSKKKMIGSGNTEKAILETAIAKANAAEILATIQPNSVNGITPAQQEFNKAEAKRLRAEAERLRAQIKSSAITTSSEGGKRRSRKLKRTMRKSRK
uniref:Uncharacterized protein n=1 Tax=viral metagenome TaxID=1070528 RepID=A0A6C0D3N6_9ZZZZ